MTTASDDPLLRLYDAEQRKIRRRLIAAFVALGLIVGGLAGGFLIARATAETATDERNQAATSADQLAGKVLSDCAETSANPATGPDATTCDQARAVAADPVVQRGATGATGATGETGATGPPGRGITAVDINNGHLIITFSDGTTRDVGVVVGPIGLPGTNGSNGSNGVDGKDGRDGTNGTNGADGKDGSPPAGWTVTEPDGSTTTCAPRDPFDPAAPRYTCTNAPKAGG